MKPVEGMNISDIARKRERETYERTGPLLPFGEQAGQKKREIEDRPLAASQAFSEREDDSFFAASLGILVTGSISLWPFWYRCLPYSIFIFSLSLSVGNSTWIYTLTHYLLHLSVLYYL